MDWAERIFKTLWIIFPVRPRFEISLKTTINKASFAVFIGFKVNPAQLKFKRKLSVLSWVCTRSWSFNWRDVCYSLLRLPCCPVWINVFAVLCVSRWILYLLLYVSIILCKGNMSVRNLYVNYNNWLLCSYFISWSLRYGTIRDNVISLKVSFETTLLKFL